MSQHDDPATGGEGRPREREQATLQLIERARRGEETAINQLFETHYDRLCRLVRSQLGPRMRESLDETQDILQSAFRGALKALPEYEPQGEDAWVRWMGTLIVNKIASRARYHAAQRRGGDAHQVGGTEGLGLLNDVPAATGTPAKRAADREARERVFQALERLKPDQRRLLLQVHVSKRTLRSVAEELDCSVDTARARLRRAEKALAAVYGHGERL